MKKANIILSSLIIFWIASSAFLASSHASEAEAVSSGTGVACTLSSSSTGNEDFTAKIGNTFTIDVSGPSGSDLRVRSMSYGDPQNLQIVMKAPFTFTVVPGTRYFFIHYTVPVPGIRLHTVETCSGGKGQMLETMYSDLSNPGTGYTITGK